MVTATKFMTAALCGAAMLVSTTVRAETNYPSRALRFIVPFVPGSITDIAARYYAKKLGDALGQSVVVENRPGANGVIGVNATLGAPNDGYTILIGTTSILATNVALYKQLPYDPIKDLAPLAMMASVPSVVIVSSKNGTESFSKLAEKGRGQSGALNYSVGATSYQLMGELLQQKANFKAVAIPYKGVGAALNAVLGAEVDFSVVDATSAIGSIQGGNVTGLAVASHKRLSVFPNVPTTAEAGINDFIASTWVAAAVPATTPDALVSHLEQVFSSIAADQETIDFFTERGAEVPQGGADGLRQRQLQEIDLWKKIVESAGIEKL